MTNSPQLEALRDGRLWEEFCDTLKEAGKAVLRPGSPDDDFDRAEGYRYLSRLTRLALEKYVEHADPTAPTLYELSHATAKIGIDNPDSAYLNATISGEHEYTIRGRRGEEPYLSFGVYYGHYGQDGPMGCSGYLEDDDIAYDADGAFELTLSRRPATSNWLEMRPDSHLLVVRRNHLDRGNERPTEFTIERTDAPGPPAPLDPQWLSGALMAAARYVGGTAGFFCDWAEDWAANPNELRGLPDEIKVGAHGDPNLFMIMGYWELADDEALVIEFEPPECPYWNLEICNHWLESLDYRYHRIDLNKHSAEPDERGRITAVVAHRDPGVPNWLETAGHRRGTMGMRWAKAAEHPIPSTRVVSVDDLETRPG